MTDGDPTRAGQPFTAVSDPATPSSPETPAELTEAIDAFAKELSIVKLEHIYAVPAVASARAALIAFWNRERDHREFLYAEAAKREERIASLSSQLERLKASQLTAEDARYCLENPPYHGFKHDLYAKLVRLRSLSDQKND